MSEIEIELGEQDRRSAIPTFKPCVVISIRGDHVLSLEVLNHIKQFTSVGREIEVK